jgi:AcrR family transcriptional regulator
VYVSRPRSTQGRRTQAERRDHTRTALIESAAKAFSRYGYGNVILEQVARDAGYTRGALYHLFQGKEDLALAVVEWVAATWELEVWRPAQGSTSPLDVLIAAARGHVVFCRRDIARVMMALRVEFDGRDHPVGHAVEDVAKDLGRRFSSLIFSGRRGGIIPPGPPAKTLAVAILGAVEGLAIHVAGAPQDEVIAERIVRGALGLKPVF